MSGKACLTSRDGTRWCSFAVMADSPLPPYTVAGTHGMGYIVWQSVYYNMATEWCAKIIHF